MMESYRKYSLKNEALPGIMGNRGMMSFISGDQGTTSQKLKGTGEQR